MLFSDDIVLVDGTAKGVNAKLKIWRKALESKSFKISKNKTEYIKYKVSVRRSFHSKWVKIPNQDIPTSEKFWYLDSIFSKDCEIVDDIIHIIKFG